LLRASAEGIVIKLESRTVVIESAINSNRRIPAVLINMM
jgi:hypothetical protein